MKVKYKKIKKHRGKAVTPRKSKQPKMRRRMHRDNPLSFGPLLNYLVKFLIQPDNYIRLKETVIPRYLAWVSNLATHKGSLETISIIKAMRVHLHRFNCGKPQVEKIHPFLHLTRDGLPRALGDLIPSIRKGDSQTLRVAYTMLSISRVLSGNKTPDYSTVSKGYSGQQFSCEFVDEIKRITKSLVTPKGVIQWGGVHFTTKRGPSGSAICSAENEFDILPLEVLESLKKLGGKTFQSFTDKEQGNILPGRMAMKVNQALAALNKDDLEAREPCLRRLVAIDDAEGKKRIIALLDYWTQSVMRPYHEDMMKILSTFRNDNTYDQHGLTGFLRITNQPVYSVDLQAATDRFPMAFQKIVFDVIYGDGDGALGECLGKVLVSLPFKRKGGDPLKYEVGQPMGAYGSWSLFTLSHHVLMHIAADRSKTRLDTGSYRILGDDVVIRGEPLYREYRLLLTYLGVEVSSLKTLESSQGEFFEFAKRPYLHNVDVGGISLKAFYQINSPMALVEELHNVFMRNFTDKWVTRTLIDEFWKSCWNLSDKIRRVLTHKTLLFLYAPFRGDGRLADPLMFMSVLRGRPLCWTQKDSVEGLLLRAFSYATQEEYSRSIRDITDNLALYRNEAGKVLVNLLELTPKPLLPKEMVIERMAPQLLKERPFTSQFYIGKSDVAAKHSALPISVQSFERELELQSKQKSAWVVALLKGDFTSVVNADLVPDGLNPLKLHAERPQAKILRLRSKRTEDAIRFIKGYLEFLEELKRVPEKGDRTLYRSEGSYSRNYLYEINLPVKATV